MAQTKASTKRNTRNKPTNVTESEEYIILSEENKTLKEQVTECEALKRKMCQLEQHNSNIRKYAKNTHSHHVSDDENTIIYTSTKNKIFPKCQYINDHNQLDKAMKILHKVQQFSEDEYPEFSLKYRDHVLSTINRLRNASVQKMKVAYYSKLLILLCCHCIHYYY